MHLRAIHLRDWKAFESARFDFPTPINQKNVILIGGKNGFGKTTLFEAIILGLYGRDGISLVQRVALIEDDDRRGKSFSNFLSKALHGRALKFGRTSCRITLIFEDEKGQPIEIERTWHFSESGLLRQGNSAEALRILEGTARVPVAPPQSEADPQAWFRNWIARRFLPAHLAGFFLFDGEAASAYAERDMGRQVRDGIEGLLGLNWLDRLSGSLREYANRRRNEVPKGIADVDTEAMAAEVTLMELDIRSAEERLSEIGEELRLCEEERDNITRELVGFGTGSRASIEELVTRRADEEKKYQNAQADLFSVSEMDLPFALAGDFLNSALAMRLEQERKREQWLSAAAETKERASNVFNDVRSDISSVEPPLSPEQEKAVEEAIKRGLERLWYPPPEGAAGESIHVNLSGGLREDVISRLRRAKSISVGTIKSRREAMDRAAASLREINENIRSTHVGVPKLEDKRKYLTEIGETITVLRIEKSEKENFCLSKKSEISQKRAELARLTSQLDQSAKPARLAKNAEYVSAMLDNLRKEAVPLQTSEIANEMSRAISSMVNRKELFSNVEISADGEVRLLGPGGRNLRDLDLSAGEKQIFTQALFSAVSLVSRRMFPLVIDTPLGRLDNEHRKNVLNHMVQRNGQVIIISTDTEVVGEYFDVIKTKILKTFLIGNKTEGDFSISWPLEGYF